jgi:hypothetical protein
MKNFKISKNNDSLGKRIDDEIKDVINSRLEIATKETGSKDLDLCSIQELIVIL